MNLSVERQTFPKPVGAPTVGLLHGCDGPGISLLDLSFSHHSGNILHHIILIHGALDVEAWGRFEEVGGYDIYI